MSKPAEKLALSLKVLRKFQNDKGIAVIKPNELQRIHRERLIANGFIREVIKGWYISSRPNEKQGDSTSWYSSYWNFVAVYFKERFNKEWCLSPEQSLAIHTGNLSVPKQLMVRSPKGQNNIIKLLHGTSFAEIKTSKLIKDEIISKEGLNLYTLSSALVNCSNSFFIQFPIDAKAALSTIKDSSEILMKLLDGGHPTIAGRLAGAFRNIERIGIADDILKAMKSAGYDVRESDPFKDKLPSFLGQRETSPYANRIKLMWNQMRHTVIENFPKSAGLPKNIDAYLKQVEEIYVTDAYHSLSIEGYRVTTELIEKVKSGKWKPDMDEKDNELRNAMVARGYWQAFQSVKKSIKLILNGKNAGLIADMKPWHLVS